MKNKKRIILLISICFSFIFIYLLVDSYKFNSDKNTKEDNKKFHITYLLIDYDKTNNSENFSNYDSNDKRTLFIGQTWDNVKKDGKYYVAKLNNINPVVFENISNYIFALNDVYGNVIDDLKFDKNKKVVYIPKKYFEDKKYSEYNDCPVKMGIISRVTKDEYKNLKVDKMVSKFINHKNTVLLNNYDQETKISIFKYGIGRNVTKKDLKIYLNGDNKVLSNDYYNFDATSGTITIDMSPIYISKIDVKIKKTALLKTSFLNIFYPKKVSAASSTANIVGTFSVTGDTDKISLEDFKNHTFATRTVPYMYGSAIQKYPDSGWKNATVICGGKVGEGDNGFECKSGYNSFENISSMTGLKTAIKKAFQSMAYGAADAASAKDYPDFILKISGFEDKTITKTKKEGNTTYQAKLELSDIDKKWVRMYCSDPSTGESFSGNNPSDGYKMQFSVYAISEKYLTLAISKAETAGGQMASGYIRFKNEPAAKLQVKKYEYSVDESGKLVSNELKKSGIIFKLYPSMKSDGSACTGKMIDMQKTNKNGVATFTGLEENETYCIAETYHEYTDNSTISSKQYIRANDITETTFTSVTPEPGDTSTNAGTSISCKTDGKKCQYYNIGVKYCVIVDKKDLNNTTTQFKNVQLCTNVGGSQKCFSNSGNQILLTGFNFEDIYTSYKKSSPDKKISITEQNVTTNTSDQEYFATLRDSDGTVLQEIPSSKAIAMTLSKNGNTYTWSCPTSSTKQPVYNIKKYQCLKVKKVDKDNPNRILSGAKFKLTCNNGATDTKTTGADGIATLYAGTKKIGQNTICSVEEIEPPTGYGLPSPSVHNNLGVSILSENEAAKYYGQSDAQVANAVSSWCPATVTDNFIYDDTSLKINWYKVLEDGTTKLKTNDTDMAAQFKVTKGGTTIYHKAGKVATQNSDTGVSDTRNCYEYSATSTGAGSDIFEADADGQVCVRGVPEGTYRVTETRPGQYHTFDPNKASIDVATVADFKPMDDTNKFINIPTGFEFTKKVKQVDGGDGEDKIVINGEEKSLIQLTTEELKKLDFEIYEADQSNNPKENPLQFVLENGVYNYVDDTVMDKKQGTPTTILHLNDERKIRVDHLAWGKTYVIREVQSKVCDSSKSEEDCIGYYYPNYSQQTSSFTITTCSNPSSNAVSCPTRGYITQQLTNTPTEIEFTKKDYYHYNDQEDVIDKDREEDETDSSVEFENAKERSDFDRIVFKLKDSNNRYLTLKFVKNHGNCLTEDSYSEYRYVYSSEQEQSGGSELHTCGGHMKITNLCRGNNYTVEEISVPEDSVYVKENTESTPTEVQYKIPCTDGSEVTQESTTKKIEDKPTRVRFEKRDSKYNYLIPDETTTFEVYRCPKDSSECHPGDYNTEEERKKAGMELVKFYPRAVITNDEEDQKDAEGLAGVEVYRAMSDSDADKGIKYETSLHPYHGILVLRYLQSGYTYSLLETIAPKNYTLPEGRNAETSFTVINTTVDVEEKDVPNKPTSLLIKKYSDNGNLLSGAQFRIYEKNKCNPNLTAKAQLKEGATLMKLKTIRDGVYESRPVADTDTITTCADTEFGKCSDISVNELTKLTYTDYLDTWADFDDGSTKTENGEKIELQEGEALIQYLEYDRCYIVEETKAPKGYSLPKDEEDRYTMVTIEKNSEYAHSTYKTLVNTPTPFKFYKYDEFNQLIDGAEFKLQKLDDNKKYYDITVTREEKDDEVYYKVDENTDNVTITTKNGSATVYYLEAGQYRILETKPAPGKELSKNPNIATFFVDDSGNVYGNAIIVNKGKTERIEVKNTASAELVVNIQTGQLVLRYGLIISILIASIAGLILLRKKMDK